MKAKLMEKWGIRSELRFWVIMVVFSMDDGQTVSVWFHNPDTTPAKLMPLDELISWKWMLNKKDVTIVVAPESGKDLNVREVARRVMRLAAKNSAAFQRANANRAASRGPGWQRAAAQTFNPAPRRIAEPTRSAASFAAKPRSDMRIGVRVFHEKFGYGTVAAQEGNKLEIDFETAGRKRVSGTMPFAVHFERRFEHGAF